MLQAADIIIRLNPADDVVIARVDIPEGTMLLREGVRTAVRIPPAALTCARPRTVSESSLTSSTLAPRGPKPVDVLTKSAPPPTAAFAADTISSVEK